MDEINLPESVKTLERAAFGNCTASKIVLSPNIIEIPEAAFYNTNVTAVALHEGITSIGTYAFRNCYSLKSVSIPKTVTSVGESIFMNASKVTDIYYNGSEAEWNSITFSDTLPDTIKVWYDDTVRVTGLTAADTDIKLTGKGETAELSLTVLPANASNKEVTFTSSNTSVARVTDNVVTAYGEGSCTITAVTNDGGYRVVFDVLVKYTRYKVNLDGATFYSGTYSGLTTGEFLKGDRAYIKADSTAGLRFNKWEYDGTFTYYSGSDTDSYITIYITDSDVDLKAVFSEIKITYLSISGNNLSVCKGESIKMSPYIVPTNVYNNTLSWSSDDESIATVDDEGNVTGHGTGYAVITATTTDGSDISATKRVEVIPKLVSDDPDKGGAAGNNGNDSDKSDKSDKSDEDSGGSGSTDNVDKGDGDLDDSGKEQDIKGVGIISADGKTLTDNSGVTYLVAENIEQEDIAKNVKLADEDTGGKYTITKVTVKSGKTVGGTVEYAGAYKENSTKVTVPATVDIAGESFKVTSVAKNTCANKKGITSVVIGKNVTKIGAGAFKGCKKLKSITIKSTKISSMGNNAFKGIHSKAVFKVPKSKLTKYKKMIKKAGAPKKSKIKKS